ncbi:methylated-DNA--[protein]-cysteine S-methyltransferase [Brevundimonas bacteroides]|uniref:methylated-DNA--[protein]-cysteine S-methyltransferase n=1 Tax=Brevundimonas bacteroides TaxID=74311 RepID=UPI000494FD09|nr:methylated-DNA--[protein]-cysteine S-methyltransferase [Brevundimonas bacteroides]
MRLAVARIDSPIGPLALAVDAEGRLRGVSFGESLGSAMRREYGDVDMLAGDAPASMGQAIGRYFEGERSALEAIDWSLEGAAGESGFQARVWRALAEVPAGQTISYGEMARRAGEPGAAQAAGVALNRNPIPLVLACHRVVGADGAMVGFGGGLERKTWLLRHEGALLI